MDIVYVLDIRKLLAKNPRETLLEIIPNEVREYELTKKKYGKENRYEEC